MHVKRVGYVTMIVLVLPLGLATAAAQEVAGSFDQLRVLVKPGDRITVTDDSGREMTGTIADLSSSSLGLLVGRERRDLPAGQVDTIRQRRSDTLANGAKWGFGIGAGLGLLGGLAVASEYEDGDGGAAVVVAATLVYGGLGAGIGVGVDALISSSQVIYARRAASSSRVSVAPLLTRRRQGVVLSLGF
jgi:hypothetical protein